MLHTRYQAPQSTLNFANTVKRILDGFGFVQQAWSLSQKVEAEFDNCPEELKRSVQNLGSNVSD